jgi:transcription termination factor Rho
MVDATSVVDARFDEPTARYTTAVELAVQRAMRAVEGGGDAVVLVDALTRLARAYSLATTGRAARAGLPGAPSRAVSRRGHWGRRGASLGLPAPPRPAPA